MPIRTNGAGQIALKGGAIQSRGAMQASLSQSLLVESTSVSSQTDLVFRTQMPIKGGEVPSGFKLVVKDGATGLTVGEANPVTDLSGEKRLINVTGVIPSIGAGVKKTLTVTAQTGNPNPGTAITLSDAQSYITAGTDDVKVECDIGGTVYEALLSDGLGAGSTWTDVGASQAASVYHGKWIENDLCTCFTVSVPLETTGGTRHKWLRAWFDAYFYKAGSAAVSGGNPIVACEVQITMENGYYDKTTPADVTYDYDVTVTEGSTPSTPISRTAFVHWYASRYRDTVWLGQEMEYWAMASYEAVKHSEMVPNWNTTSAEVGTLTTTTLDTDSEPFSGLRGYGSYSDGSMEEGAMAMDKQVQGWARESHAGYRWITELGEVPAWFKWHWRDETTGGIVDLPNISATATTWRMFKNGGTGGDLIEFPASSANPWKASWSHNQGALYPAYLATGDRHFLDEMQLTCQYIWGHNNTSYMEYDNSPLANGYKRIPVGDANQIVTTQRAQAWQLRDLINCAAVTPDTIDGTAMNWTQTIARTWLNNQMDFFADEITTLTATGSTPQSGKSFVVGGPRFTRFAKGYGEYPGGDISGYMIGFVNLVLMHGNDLNVLDTNGVTFRDWFCSGAISAANLTGWGAAKDQLMDFYWRSVYDPTRVAAGENKVQATWEYLWYLASSRMVENARSEARSAVGCTLSATSGAAVTVTFDSPVFTYSTDLTWYEGQYVFESMGTSGGKGKITSVSSSTVCTIDTTYTHMGGDAGYDGATFSGTSLAAGNVHYPAQHYSEGSDQTMVDTSGQYYQISRSAYRAMKDAGLTDAAAALTWFDGLDAVANAGTKKWRYSYDERTA